MPPSLLTVPAGTFCCDCSDRITPNDSTVEVARINQCPMCVTTQRNYYCDPCTINLYVCEHSNCEQLLCEEHALSCRGCGAILCGGCYFLHACPEEQREEDDDDEEDGYSNSSLSLQAYFTKPQILDYSTKPQWQFQKKPWENTLYLGVELEMNFPRGDYESVLAIPGKYLQGNAIWKHDGSISHGAELVLAPTTLQKFKDYNLREMFKRLIKAGCLSHKSGQCGLHVHVNAAAFTPKRAQIERNLKAFLSLHKTKIRKISRRGQMNLNHWARIPDLGDSHEWCSRNVALNCQARTWEFRLFRGTLRYDTFLASIQFVDAICSFVKSYPTAYFLHYVVAKKKKKESWTEFVKFCLKQNRYHALTAYLKGKQLCA